MKLKFTLLMILTACSASLFAQTIPFGFNYKGMPIPISIENFLKRKDADTSKLTPANLPHTNSIADDYINLAKVLESNANKMDNDATNQYNTGYDTLTKNPPSDQSGVDQLNLKLKALTDALSLSSNNSKALRDAAKGYRFLAKTTKPFNYFFVGNSIDAEMYYNGTLSDSKTKFLNNSLISFGTDGGSATIYNELYADYIGPVRIGFGALISNKQTAPTNGTTDTATNNKNNAIQQLLGGGGNGVLNASYPLLNYQRGNSFFIKLIAAPKIGVDVPKIGTDNSSYAFNYNLGVEGSVFYTGALNVLTFYSNFRFARIAGNGLFYDNLSKTDHQSFGFDQLSFGIAITSSFRLSYNYYFGSAFVNKNFPSTISFTVIPN